jgi:epoxide hydrolase 4
VEPLRHGTASCAGVRLHYVHAGTGPPVLLLHGFPDFWYSWRRQVPALRDAGFHAVAPDLRGYNRSDAPRRVRDYSVRPLVDDIACIIRGVCGGRAVVAGHDWGGLIAWHLAAAHPELVSRLVILNAPHPARFRQLLTRTTQLLRSWYAGALQLPWLPERIVAARGAALLRRTLARSGTRDDAFTDDDLQCYAEAFATPEALRGPMNYYRASMRQLLTGSGGMPLHVPVPTVLLWGTRDPHLDVRNTEGLERWVPDLRVVRLERAAHWVHLDAPDEVNAELIAAAQAG